MKKNYLCIALSLVLLLAGCSDEEQPLSAREQLSSTEIMNEIPLTTNIIHTSMNNPYFSYQVDAQTMELSLQVEGVNVPVSIPLDSMETEQLIEDDDFISWIYPKEEIRVEISQKENYLAVTLESLIDDKNSFVWPMVSGENYIMPINEGKYIPANDPHWISYLQGEEWDTIESLSMAFFSAVQGDYAVVYIMEDNYNNKLQFGSDEKIEFSLEHEFPSINPKKTRQMRIYLTENNPVQVAKIYKEYIVEQGRFKTLSEKAEENPNIEKLYGAPHIYLWDTRIISEDDINWPQFHKQSDGAVLSYVETLLTSMVEEGEEAVSIFHEIKQQDYVDNYQQRVICGAISQVLKLPEFYNKDIFTKLDSQAELYVNKGIEKLNSVELIELNKHLLFSNMDGVFAPVEQWANDGTVELIEDIYDAGIEKAWLGFNNWELGFHKPQMVELANEKGYLIGTYDSYHSIHESGKEQWNTAAFPDDSLYENATVTLENGEKAKGFQGVGRKLNPTLSFSAVEQRTKEIMDTGVKFNSWFIDCDATGEVYDDYSPNHLTTKEQDVAARNERMAYIRDSHSLVIGSEGGQDYAATTIAFAHGIELPAFSWMDSDMRSNKESEYYMGRYFNPNGEVPEKYSKPVPIKDEFYPLFLDQSYNLPLYKLVYNDSVITTNHWDWSSLKLRDEVQNRMLYSILYNVPPMYHLDKFEWEENKSIIIEQTNLYTPFSQDVINLEMTDFQVLTDDRLVQMTQYGNGQVTVIANFSENEYTHDGTVIPSESLVIYKENEIICYPE